MSVTVSESQTVRNKVIVLGSEQCLFVHVNSMSVTGWCGVQELVYTAVIRTNTHTHLRETVMSHSTAADAAMLKMDVNPAVHLSNY